MHVEGQPGVHARHISMPPSGTGRWAACECTHPLAASMLHSRCAAPCQVRCCWRCHARCADERDQVSSLPASSDTGGCGQTGRPVARSSGASQRSSASARPQQQPLLSWKLPALLQVRLSSATSSWFVLCAAYIISSSEPSATHTATGSNTLQASLRIMSSKF